MANALVILAKGAEEMETAIIVDVLRRGGVDVTLAGLDGPEPVLCSRGMTLVPDKALADAPGPFDVIVLPGGNEGAKRLAASGKVGALLREQERASRDVAAICAAPIALAQHDVFRGKRMTAYPSVHDVVGAHGEITQGPVVEDGHVVTSQGPGTAFAFALSLVARLTGPAKAHEVEKGMLLKHAFAA